MTHTKTKYLCDLCNREYSTEDAAKRHEGKCYFHLDSKACITCANFVSLENDDIHWQEFGEDVCMSGGHSVECKIKLDIESAGMENGSIIHVLRSGCEGWCVRTIKGTYRYGKAMIEEV